MLEIVGTLAAGMLMEEFWKRRAWEELPGRPIVALMPELKLPERAARSRGVGDAELNGHVLLHCNRTQFGRREPAASAVKSQ